ncbi:MAG TPA: UDP-N-acetylmuramoyl-L-alanine--D-glutamate ligase [Aliidongia sp.]|uniref:UDP-N-acetylmuramoyl-L-alanine--D-glutamate ligase n=1 Tax=Aliidongia sp. TaxID=1914230 RepID=UPI002DDDA9C9|nr:UDP-N-acetylmuramoyl-L-alanine--D-glutamate ligase [Aliidongia sp.]HEV2676706.1 UDP-N-acetylmuramoyl-L-alanine--D-glutamate ligase [Aliidongia sp.]
MIATLPFRDRTVAVLGLARSGLVAAQALEASGARVVAWDDGEKGRAAGRAAGLSLANLATVEPLDWSALVMSPGIPLTHPTPHPAATRALDAGIEVIGDIELLARAGTGARFLGITGTNGKSTTTALIGHVLAAARRPAAVGGNLGIPALSLPELGSDGHYVIEMSSFQLDLVSTLRFGTAILLNVTPDHLDRHGDMAGYIAAKRRIFHNQVAGDTAILGVDDDHVRALAAELTQGPARLVRISAEGPVAGGVSVVDGRLIDHLDEAPVAIMDLRPVPTLPGRHNWQNAAAAYAACRVAGVAPAEIAAALATYPGLPHRQELAASLPGLRFVNDSKATNADAAAKALGCYERIYWIAGGLPKAGGIASLAPFFPRLAGAFLIGQASDEFARTLDGHVAVTRSGDLATAIADATAAARRDGTADGRGDGVVLLSPACASYDQFASYEARGDAFRALARKIVDEARR